MTFNNPKLMFIFFLVISFSSWGESYNKINIDGLEIQLSRKEYGVMNVLNTINDSKYSCAIKNWQKTMSSGAGIISLTSDKVGVLIAPGNKYLKVNDIKFCHGKSLQFYDIPFIDSKIASVVDVNFKEELILALVVIDAHFRTYQAIISTFNGEENILSGKGFWQDLSSGEHDVDDSFSTGKSIYIGKISLDGKYVAPYDVDCTTNSFPGVWDIKKKVKVIFKNDIDNQRKCNSLFY
jgi:hypothetical protein